MKMLRTTVPVLALAALASAGCFLISGQFVVNFALPTPFTAVGGGTLQSVDVDLNTIGDYSDHKDDLKRVDDLALIGDFKNNLTSGSPAQVECWIVPAGTAGLTYAQLTTPGTAVKLWGPISVAANATEKVDWNRSAALFAGRQTLIDEIKGDGQFRLYVATAGAFNVTITNGALIAVVGAGK